MARLSRYAQLIFGSTSGTNTMAQFGSLAASAPLLYNGTTITPSIVQALANYLEGWPGAVVGQNSPGIEDMNALCYLFAYQLAYSFQAGIPEYDATTTYYTGSLVMSSGYTYVSLTDTNVGNALTSTANWAQAPQNGMVTPNTLPKNTVVLTGTSLTWPNLTIPTGVSLVVNAGGNFEGLHPITVASGGILTINGTSTIL